MRVKDTSPPHPHGTEVSDANHQKSKAAIALAILVVGGASGLYGFTPVQAASSSSVVIAEDVTAHSNCTLTLASSSEPSEIAVESLCPLGTIIVTRTVTEQYARSRHVPFVVLPSRSADQRTLHAVSDQIGRLLDDKSMMSIATANQRNTLQTRSAASPMPISCGSTATVGANANLGFNGPAVVFGSVNYYKDPSCGYVTLNQAYAQVMSPAGAHVY